MTLLEHVYLMNVVLYFTKEEEVLKFVEINKKCENVIQSMKINPFLENTSFERIKQLFKSIETYQLERLPENHSTELFNGVSIIEYNNNKDLFSYYPNDIKLYAHKIRKLHSVQINADFEDVVENFSILRSLTVDTPYNYNLNKYDNSIQPLFKLKDVITLKELTINISTYVCIEDLIKLKKLLRNIKITVVIQIGSFEEDINTEYINTISNIIGINVYVSRFNHNLNNKYVMPLDYFEFDLSSILKNKDFYYQSFSLCYPTQLSILHDVFDELNYLNEKNDLVEELNFDEYSILKDLSITLPEATIINFYLPTTLENLSITSHGNKGLNYDSFQTIPLLTLNICFETNNNIILPSTLTNLFIESCSNCNFMFEEKWSLQEIEIFLCNGCTIPICDTYKIINNSNVNENKYVKYGNVSNIEHFFKGELFSKVSIWESSIEIEMCNNAHIDVLDMSCFKTTRITLTNINTNKLIFGDCNKINLTNSEIKEIIFGVCEGIMFDNISSINTIKGEYVNSFSIKSESKPQFLINNLKRFSTYSTHIPQLPFQILQLNNIKEEEVIDLKSLNITSLNLRNSDIKKIIVPSTLTSFEDFSSNIQIVDNLERTNILYKKKIEFLIKYCNGKLPEVNYKQLTLNSRDWEIIDARNLKVVYLTIVNCKNVKQILVSQSLKTLVISNCDSLETLDLTPYQITVLNINNCKLINKILVNDNVKQIIDLCPSLK
ncbi:hypothetical protein QTN25_010522 [Entamoeba marina]